jgi:hypothetical protein
MYAAGMDCLSIEEGVIGDRKESVRVNGSPPIEGLLIE